MGRAINCCLALCCISRKKSRQSFPIHAKKFEEKPTEKITVRPVETLRVATIKKISTIEEKSVDKTRSPSKAKSSETHSEKLFSKAKQSRTSSPISISIQPIGDDKNLHSLSSEWPSTTTSDPIMDEKKIDKLFANALRPPRPPSGKSKLVLQNVKKMIEDRNIQGQNDQLFEAAQL